MAMWPFAGTGCQNSLASPGPTTRISPRAAADVVCPFMPVSSALWFKRIILRHELIDERMQLVPRRIDEVVVAHGESRADEELFIRCRAARVIGSDQIPGKLEELHALDGTVRSGIPERLEH